MSMFVIQAKKPEIAMEYTPQSKANTVELAGVALTQALLCD